MEINNPYSPLKIFHHQDKIGEIRNGIQPVPLQVQLIISDLCNQSCGFCSYRMDGYDSNQLFYTIGKDGTKNNNPNRIISYEKCREIINDCVELGVKAIQLTGGGEPTAHPAHSEIFEYIISRGLDLALVSNFMKVGENAREILTNAQWIRISIDSSNKYTYANTRKTPLTSFDRVIQNIKEFIALRNRLQRTTTVGIGFVVTKYNWEEVYDAVKLYKSLGVDNVRISAMFNSDNEKYFSDFHKKASILCSRTKEDFESETFKVFNLFGDRLSDLKEQNPDYWYCGYMNLNTYIGGDLNVYTCCNNAYNERGLIGSLKGTRFKELWKSKEKELMFKNFNAKNCPRCMFNNKNKTILYSIQDNPTHVNYI